MMRLLSKLFLLVLTLLTAQALCAREQKVRDIDINITLIHNGCLLMNRGDGGR